MSTSPMEQQTAPSETSIFDTAYDKEVLQDNLKYDLSRTRNSLFIIAGILLLSDILSLSLANALDGTMLIYVLVVPCIFVGLGFFSTVKPITGMSLAALLFVLMIAYTIYALGARAIVSGLIIKAVIIYFFIKGFDHAKQAEEAKNNLSSYS